MNLTRTAILTKRVILFTSIFLFISIGGFISYKIWYAYYLAQLPPVEEKADIKFGNLPYPSFPTADVSSSNFSYSIDTTTGILPKPGENAQFPKLVKVYFIPKPYSGLLSADKSKVLAQKFKIDVEPEVISENTYLFKTGSKSLTVNLDSGNFQYTNEASPEAEVNLDNEPQLVNDLQRNIELLVDTKPQIDKGRNKIIYFQNADGRLIATNARADASYIQLSLWPNNIDDKIIYTANIDKSLINALVYKSARDLQTYTSLNFINWSVDTTTSASYPAKSTEEAFEELKSGKGTVVLKPQKTQQISITDISLGYYIPENYTPYLQPIYIFKGPDFIAYIPAVSQQYIASQ